MKALSVQQPWAELIARGVKTLEVRSWRTWYRGPLLIVSSLKVSRLPEAKRYPDILAEAPRGVTVCTVDLVDIREGKPTDARRACVQPVGRQVWLLANPTRVPARPAKGKLKLFDLPDAEASSH